VSAAPPPPDERTAGAPRRRFRGGVPAGPSARQIVSGASVGPTEQSMRRRGPLDRTALVWEPDAFTGFAPSADYERVRDLIGRPTPGGADVDRGGVAHALLPALQCGAPHPDDPEHRCGLSLTPMRTDDEDGYAYTSTRCSLGERGHRASFRTHIERPVLEMIAEAYAPASMERAVRAVQARSDASARELAAMDRAIAEAEADYGRASRLETEAHRDERPLDVQHWADQRRAAQQTRNALQQQRRDYRQSLTDLSPAGGLEHHLGIVRSVTRDVASLTERSLRLPGMTAALVRLVTRAITIRQVAPGLAVVEVEFPNGARSERVVLTGKTSGTQPERAVAHHALVTGGDLDAVVARLTPPTGAYGPRLLLTPDRVRSLALLHRFFEPVPARTGPLEAVPALAARLREDVAAVEAAALSGALGAAGVASDDTLLVAPTDVELEGTFDAYAARQVEAREEGWARGDAVLMRALRRDYGIAAMTVARAVRMETPGRYAHDLAGRRYVRKSAIPPKLLARASQAGGLVAFRTAARAAIDAAGYSATAVEDWWLIGELLKVLRTRAGVGSAPGIRKARDEGRLLHIRYRGPHMIPGNRSPDVLIYCPAELATSGDKERAQAWYRGETPRPPRDGAGTAPE
jgi:hypothetical protein